MRSNLKYFLERVIPTAKEYGINLCIHSDDPPYAVLGLPRIVGNEQDIEWILQAVDEPNNGLTFCAGSLSSGLHNDVAAMAERFASRTHFVHLRSTDAFEDGDFVEANHLAGRGDLVDVVEIFIKQEKVRKAANRTDCQLPMRVDHGLLMLGDIENNCFNPGYSFMGCMKALGEMSGVIATIEHKLKKDQAYSD